MSTLKTYFVSFGVGTFMRGYYQEVHAYDRDIVAVLMNKRYPMLWSHIYETTPRNMKPLQAAPEVLAYEKASHISR